jgi:hypothetical protein
MTTHLRRKITIYDWNTNQDYLRQMWTFTPKMAMYKYTEQATI